MSGLWPPFSLVVVGEGVACTLWEFLRTPHSEFSGSTPEIKQPIARLRSGKKQVISYPVDDCPAREDQQWKAKQKCER